MHLVESVQEEAIPEGLAGNDLVAQAKSGMGKTAVFVTVALERITADAVTQCLVLVHTRELAFQVKHEFDRFKLYLQPPVEVQVVYGGVDIREQEKAIKAKTPHIIVGCPGRLKQLIEKSTVNLNGLKIFVIDEVDKVLELSLIHI